MHDVDLVMRAGVRALPLFLLLAGCGSSTNTSVTAPTGSAARCQPTIQGSQTSFGPAGGTGTVTIGVERECSWSASSLAGWIEITSAREGQGDATLSYRVQPNADPIVRRGGLTVSERRLDLTQEAAACRFDVSRPAGMGAEGGQTRVEVSAHTTCHWTASSDAPWAAVSPPSGAGTGAVLVSVQPNSGSTRTATLAIGGQQVPLTQSARSAPPPPPAPPPSPGPPAPGPPPAPGCSFRLTPQDRDFSALGGIGSFKVETAGGCTWSASSEQAWVQVSASGSGNGEVRYLVLPNISRQNRETRITVAGSSHRITQKGAEDDDDDDDDDTVKVNGILSGLSGSCPNLRFTVSGTVVTTSGRTEFRKGSCRDVTAGREVEAEGERQPDGAIAARRVELKN